MSNYNWNRAYKIVFGKPKHETSAYTFEGTVVGNLPAPQIEVDAVTEPAGNVVSMSNLVSEDETLRGFKFTLNSVRIASGTGSSGEKSVLTLYNLNPETLEVLNQEGCVVRVYAGYQGAVNLVYSGDIEEVSPKTEGQDIAYKIDCKDGSIDLKNTRVSIQYSENISMANIVRDLASRFPSASLGSTTMDSLESKFITGGYSCQGKLSDIFDKVCQKNQLTYSRFNGKISVRPEQLIQGLPDYLIVERNTYTLLPDTLHIIDPILANKGKSTNQANVKRGIQLTTFLIPVTLDQFITILPETSQQYAGTYKITKIMTKLNSIQGAWTTSLKCEPM